MTDFPTLAYLSSAARTEGEMKTALDAIVAGAREFPGGAAETTLTIASGNVTPGAGAAGIFSIDTEAAAAADDLANIVQTNVRDGALLLIRCANAARVVTVKHNAGGAGTIVLAGAADLVLDATTKWLWLKRTSTSWQEIGRFPVGAGTTSAAGLLELLLDAEALTGTDTARAMTAANLAHVLLTRAAFFVGATTRDLTAATGTQAVTGVGFRPRAVIFLAQVSATSKVSVGVDDGTTGVAVANNHASAADTWTRLTNRSIFMVHGAADDYRGVISALGADGFTISWTKAGSPTGTANVLFLAIR